MKMNITFRLDENLIRQARAKAQKTQTSLNFQIEQFLKNYTHATDRLKKFDHLMEQLKGVRLKQMPNREQRHER